MEKEKKNEEIYMFTNSITLNVVVAIVFLSFLFEKWRKKK